MLHYHGTPITPRSALLALAGRCFCVSFAEPRDVAVCHEIGQSVMLDNGAFSAWRSGKPIVEWSGYYEWCARWLEHWTTWAVIPDVIDGDEDANPGSDRWHGRMAEAMEVACDAHGRPRTRLHLLRGLRWSSGPYPLYSADSTTVARNHSGIASRGEPPRDAARMAAAIDGRQPPARWRRPVGQQLTLGALAPAGGL